MRIVRFLIAAVFSLGLLAAPKHLCPMRDQASCAPVPAAEEAMPCHAPAEKAPAKTPGCPGMLCCLAGSPAASFSDRLVPPVPGLGRAEPLTVASATPVSGTDFRFVRALWLGPPVARPSHRHLPSPRGPPALV